MEAPFHHTDEAYKDLIEAGENLGERILAFLSGWPRTPSGGEMILKDTHAHHQEECHALVIETRKWFNLVKLRVGSIVIYESSSFHYTMRRVDAAIRKCGYIPPNPQIAVSLGRESMNLGSPLSRGDYEIQTPLDAAKQEARDGIDIALDLVRSAPPPEIIAKASAFGAGIKALPPYQRDTAFILMPMDKEKPELEDVSNAIKEVCHDFGIQAQRADDVEHQDVITEMVLQNIRESEFLIADLTDERPNVYYEVGYAHAVGKRPILYRREGTRLHFDLSVHNVPAYRNLTELKQLLHKRLEAMTGRTPGKPS